MSRTRIVGGKYTKLTKGTHYMFSDENISTFTSKKIHEEGIEDGILLSNAKKYEPWKNGTAQDWYSGIFGYTINKRISIEDLGINKEVQMCLTAISSVIRFEYFDLDSDIPYKYSNQMFMLTLMMNNRGELVEGELLLFEYKANRLVDAQGGGDTRELDNIRKTTYKLKSKGKDLHDEIFLDKKLIFADGSYRNLDMDSNSSKEDYYFYNRVGNFVKEASIFNRRADVSYIFGGMGNADSFFDATNNTNSKISLVTDCPLLKKAIDRFSGISLFTEMFGVFSYSTGAIGNVSDLSGLKSMRGPIMLDDVQCMKKRILGIGEEPIINYFTNNEHYHLSTDFEKLQIALKTNYKKEKDE